MSEFYDRKNELSQLESLWREQGAQFLTLWGRRRVGKSTVLSRFARNKRAVYLYGTRETEANVLSDLSFQVAQVVNEPYLRTAPFPSWADALEYLAGKATEQRLLLVLDEFPYLCEVTRGLDTVVQRWWDQYRSKANLMVVLAGSAFSFMESLTGVRGALHGRRTSQLDIQPFDYFDAAEFYRELEPADRVRAFACLGGIPAYLQHWKSGLTLQENLRRTILSPQHVLFREGEELLRTEFHQEALYASILRACAAGQHRLSDLARSVGKRSADQIFDHIRRLQELGFIRREVPVTEIQSKRSFRVLYRLADPYLRFWFQFVAPFRSFLQLGRAEEFWNEEVSPALDEFVARTTWEEVCIQFVWRRAAARDSRIPKFSELGRWWDSNTEIDLVALWKGKVVLVGECKWTNSQVDRRTLTALKEKAKPLPLARDVVYLLASRSGFREELQDEEGVLLLTPQDLYF